jgi:hypothetical protein
LAALLGLEVHSVVGTDECPIDGIPNEATASNY